MVAAQRVARGREVDDTNTLASKQSLRLSWMALDCSRGPYLYCSHRVALISSLHGDGEWISPWSAQRSRSQRFRIY